MIVHFVQSNSSVLVSLRHGLAIKAASGSLMPPAPEHSFEDFLNKSRIALGIDLPVCNRNPTSLLVLPFCARYVHFAGCIEPSD